MNKNKDCEMTPERAEKIKELLKKLFEDQYKCKLAPVNTKAS